MSTISIDQVASIRTLRNNRLVNSMRSSCAQAFRGCGGCPNKRKPNPSTCVTLLKTVATKHRAEIAAALGLPSETVFSVSRVDKAIVLVYQ